MFKHLTEHGKLTTYEMMVLVLKFSMLKFGGMKILHYLCNEENKVRL